MGRDAGWGGERQHPNLEHLSLASSVRSSVCPDSSMFTSSMEFGDLGMSISLSLSQTPRLISSQRLTCPLEREHGVMQKKK